VGGRASEQALKVKLGLGEIEGRDREIERQRYRDTEIQRDRETEIQRDRETDIETELTIKLPSKAG